MKLLKLLILWAWFSGTAFAQSPVQFAQAFECGKVRNPVVKGYQTQTRVMVRCPDGSARHVIFYLISKVTELTKYEIVEGKPVTGPGPAFLAQGEMTGTTILGSVSTPFSYAANDLPYETWVDGPIATTRIYRDRKSQEQFSPEFHVTCWHTLKKCHVRFVGNNDNASKVAELWMTVELSAGGKVLYSKPAFPLSRASRWTKSYWIDTAPVQVNVRPNFAQLIKTGALPNYDTSIKINASALDSIYANWQKAAKDLTDAGNLTKAMGGGGGRPELGPYPTWTVLWLYTGDRRMREVAVGNADLAAAWHTHYRQTDGKYYSIEDNPGSQLLNLVGVTRAGDTDSWGWVADLSHQPAMFYPLYLLTGDPFYLQEMLYWASWSAAYSNGGAINNSCGRGPTGKEGGFPGEISCLPIRGSAWGFRNRAEVAWITPDHYPERAYFDRLTREAIKILEGERGVGDLTDPLRAWGQRVNPVNRNNPLHWWSLGNNLFVQSPLDPAKSNAAISTWEQNFMIYALGRAKDLGYPTEPLLAWAKVNIDGMLAVDHRLMATYRSATLKKDGTPYKFEELPSTYEAGFSLLTNWNLQIINSEHGYGFVAIPAGNLNAVTASANSSNPKWVILPRK